MLSFIDVFSAVALYTALTLPGTWLIRKCFYEDYEVVGWRFRVLSPMFLVLAAVFVVLGLVILVVLAITFFLLWLAAPKFFSAEERYTW
jgi:hypothetical protein